MRQSIECAHCKAEWIAEENCLLVLADGNKGCGFCLSREGQGDLGYALSVGFGKVSARRMSLAEAKGDPLAMQVGGDHYKSMKIQPVEFIEANQIPFLEGNVIKYVVRHVGKGGVADLRKARHYIDLLLKLRYGEAP